MAAYRDWECEACDLVVERLTEYRVIPLCPTCRGPMTWLPTISRAFSIDSFRAPLVLPVLGGVEVTSLRQVRELERMSERAARNGEGEQYVARAWAQEPGNLSVSTLPVPTQRAPKTRDAKGREKVGVRVHADEPSVTLGPGLTGRSSLSKDGS